MIVVGAWCHRRPSVETEDAAIRERARLRRVGPHDPELLVAGDRGLFVEPLRCVRRQPRDAAVRRIDDQRRAFVADDLRAALVPELVVGNHASRTVLTAALLGVDEIAVLPEVLLTHGVRRLGVGERPLVAETARPLEWSDGAEVPHALEIELTVRRSRRRPRA